MSKMYVKIVDVKVLFSNSFGYTKKGGKEKLFIHCYGIACDHGSGRMSHFIVKTFNNKKPSPLAGKGEYISLTGELIEEKWKDKNDNWVSRVAIIADHIEIIGDIDDEDDEDEDEDENEVTNKKSINRKKN